MVAMMKVPTIFKANSLKQLTGRMIFFLFFYLISDLTVLGDEPPYCPLVPVLDNVSPSQPRIWTVRKYLQAETDCKKKCEDEERFECKAILWKVPDGICYLIDAIDLESKTIHIDTSGYILYMKVCDGKAIGTFDACKQLCATNFDNTNCEAFVTGNDGISQCFIYEKIPDGKFSDGDCNYSSWSEWSECSATCDEGTQTRERHVIAYPSKSGLRCLESERIQRRRCNQGECPGCKYTPWSEFGVCSVPCGKGKMTRSRTVRECAYDDEGPQCRKSALDQTTECDESGNTDCPGECQFSEWSSWSQCDERCTKFRTRELLIGDPTLCFHKYGPHFVKLFCTDGACTGTDKCYIGNVNPNTQVSSSGQKHIEKGTNCLMACKEETEFACEAYITGPHGECIIYGAINRTSAITQSYGGFVLHDLKCQLKSITLCSWKQYLTGVNADYLTKKKYKFLGDVKSTDECADVCAGTFRSRGCLAFAVKEFEKYQCFFHPAVDSKMEEMIKGTAGDFHIYVLDCTENGLR